MSQPGKSRPGKWVPSPWSKKEQKLRKILDAKNLRERKRKNRKIENADNELLEAATAWVQEDQDDSHDLDMEVMEETGTGEATSSNSIGATSSQSAQGTLCIAVCFKHHFYMCENHDAFVSTRT